MHIRTYIVYDEVTFQNLNMELRLPNNRHKITLKSFSEEVRSVQLQYTHQRTHK